MRTEPTSLGPTMPDAQEPRKKVNVFAAVTLLLACASVVTASHGGGQMAVIPFSMALTVGLFRFLFQRDRWNWHLFWAVSIVLSVMSGTGMVWGLLFSSARLYARLR